MNLGRMRHSILLENPTGRTPDGDGGYTQAWEPLTPSQASCSLENANARALERVANTVVTQATHIVRMRYHPDVSTQTRVTWRDRAGNSHLANVIDVTDVDEQGTELVLLISEITT